MAKAFEAELTLLHIWEIPVYPYMATMVTVADLTTAIEQAANQSLIEQFEIVKKELPRAKALLMMGTPWHDILDKSKELQADLIVMGTHGRRGFNHMLMGSVAEKVVRLAEAPVLTVHGPRS